MSWKIIHGFDKKVREFKNMLMMCTFEAFVIGMCQAFLALDFLGDMHDGIIRCAPRKKKRRIIRCRKCLESLAFSVVRWSTHNVTVEIYSCIDQEATVEIYSMCTKIHFFSSRFRVLLSFYTTICINLQEQGHTYPELYTDEPWVHKDHNYYIHVQETTKACRLTRLFPCSGYFRHMFLQDSFTY